MFPYKYRFDGGRWHRIIGTAILTFSQNNRYLQILIGLGNAIAINKKAVAKPTDSDYPNVNAALTACILLMPPHDDERYSLKVEMSKRKYGPMHCM